MRSCCLIGVRMRTLHLRRSCHKRRSPEPRAFCKQDVGGTIRCGNRYDLLRRRGCRLFAESLPRQGRTLRPLLHRDDLWTPFRRNQPGRNRILEWNLQIRLWGNISGRVVPTGLFGGRFSSDHLQTPSYFRWAEMGAGSTDSGKGSQYYPLEMV